MIRFDDTIAQTDMRHWLFMLVIDAVRPKVQVEYKGETNCSYTEEAFFMVLTKTTKIKETAGAYLGKPVTSECYGHCASLLP